MPVPDLPLQQNMNGIPFIDFAQFGQGNPDIDRDIGFQFFTACKNVGFAYLVNTCMNQERVNDLFDWSRKFFELPLESKLLAVRPKDPTWHRGFSGVGREQISQQEYDPEKLAELRKVGPDYKESFDIGKESGYGTGEPRLPNVWLPNDFQKGGFRASEFRASANTFFNEGRQLQKQVLKALAIGLPGADNDFFESYHQEAENQVRLLHYLSAPADNFLRGDKGRCAAHTDFGTCTFLFQDPKDTMGGLEVEDPHQPGRFIPAPPVDGAIVFNIGDFLMRWSNDTLKSTLHRVRAPSPTPGQSQTPARFSIPYFVGADPNKIIDCLPGCYGPDRPKRYEAITSKDYIDMRMTANY